MKYRVLLENYYLSEDQQRHIVLFVDYDNNHPYDLFVSKMQTPHLPLKY
ncbi:hypothetical protein [Pseudovibrio japonicus]|nr:hypothetical protein [Pseudovibrio japonicus]